MCIVYNLVIALYSFAIRLIAPFNEKAQLLHTGRKDAWAKIRSIKLRGERVVWFHAASLGEFEQGRPVMERLKKAEPKTKIVLTFFSPSGYEIRKNYAGADYIFYLPADTASNAAYLIRQLCPDAAVFIKYEFWFHYLQELHKQNVPVYLISSIFRKEQPFFKSWGGLHRQMLRFFKKIYVQDDTSATLLKSIGISHFEVSGDTRFDRVKEIADAGQAIEKVETFLNGRPAIVCGSTWSPDEEILMDYINAYTGDYKWIIAPHEIGDNHVKAIIEKCRKRVVRYTEAEKTGGEFDVMIIDCIGLLSAIYRYGKMAYIGGGFGIGIHNTLEAAVYGIPVVFGPKYQKFNEAISLVREGGSFSVDGREKLNDILDSLLSSPVIAETAGRKALNYVNSQLGATEAIMQDLLSKK